VKIAEDWPAIWAWNGSCFQKLDKPKAEQIRREFPLSRDLVSTEGWRESELDFGPGTASMDLNLDSQKFTLVLRRVAIPGLREVEQVMIRTEQAGSASILVAEATNGYRPISKSEYLRVRREMYFNVIVHGII
jgi:hypothetical protein